MNEILTQITNNPLLILTTQVATIIALIIAVIVPIIQKRRKELYFEFKTEVLVSDTISEVEGLNVLYDKKQVDQLSVTICQLCNVGNVIIEGKNDLYSKLSLVPREQEIHILDAKCVLQSNDTIECEAEVVDNTVELNFNAFEKKDRATINVYHTGKRSTRFDIEGRIKEGKILNSYRNLNYKRVDKFLAVLLVLDYIAAFLALPIYTFLWTWRGDNAVLRAVAIITFIIVFYLFAFNAANLLALRRALKQIKKYYLE